MSFLALFLSKASHQSYICCAHNQLSILHTFHTVVPHRRAIEEDGLLAQVTSRGERLRAGLKQLQVGGRGSAFLLWPWAFGLWPLRVVHSLHAFKSSALSSLPPSPHNHTNNNKSPLPPHHPSIHQTYPKHLAGAEPRHYLGRARLGAHQRRGALPGLGAPGRQGRAGTSSMKAGRAGKGRA